jgi:hypothetical protein
MAAQIGIKMMAATPNPLACASVVSSLETLPSNLFASASNLSVLAEIVVTSLCISIND